MKSLETIIWDGPVQTWQFPLNDNQRLMLSTHHASVDGYVAIAAVAPDYYEAPDLILSLPTSIPDLKVNFYEEQDEPFIIRFGRMPAEVLANLREHDGW